MTDTFDLYTNIVTVANAKAPFDPDTYGGNDDEPCVEPGGRGPPLLSSFGC